MDDGDPGAELQRLLRLDLYGVALAGTVAVGELARTLWFDIRAERQLTEELPVIADLLAGASACGRSTKPAIYTGQLSDWIMDKANESNVFHDVPVAVMRDWITASQPAINTCSLHTGRLPHT